tara:strand:+ start:451 stop:621 length:171 start_codon:yes stop_codon:yes gene_type:complete
MRDQFTIEQVKYWLGSDATYLDALGIITEIANDKFPLDFLRSDISINVQMAGEELK